MIELTVEITGLRLSNPAILAAGILGTTGGSLKRIAQSGAGAVVTKSLGIEQRSGHHNPSLIKLECGYLNAMGLPNPSYKNFKYEMDTAKQGGVPVIASIFGGCSDEFVEVAAGMEQIGADALELNVSCPHAGGYGTDIGTDPELVEEITKAVKGTVSVPVWVKLTPNVTDITEIGLAAERGGSDAVVAINTLRGMAIDIDSGYPILGNRFGGVSGTGIRPVAVRCVFELYEALKIPVIGVGGVSGWRDVVEFMMAGASAVEIGSAVGENMNVFSEIRENLYKFLSIKGWAIKDIIGLAHRVSE